ncbi:MAG TPA: hypothetical protein PLU93_07080 [Treponemataceae bacterium]|nr:hypothetical protein [Treponemataceae bacterium]
MADLSDRERRRLKRSVLVSLAFWSLVLIMFLLAPAGPRKKDDVRFQTVSLNLAPRHAPREVSRASSDDAPRPARAKATKNAKAAKAASKAASASAGSPAAGATVPSLGIPNFSTPLSTPRTNDSAAEVLEYSSERASTAPRESSGRSVSEFEGVAATAKVRGGGSSSGASSQNQTTRSGASGADASAETKRALAAIGDASAAGSDSGDVSGSDSGTRQASVAGTAGSTGDSTRAKASGSGPVVFDGRPRRLVYPADPAIALPPHLARLIDSDRTVTVAFTVRADGSVPATLVTFTPTAALPAEVREYLRAEFARWRFDQDREDGHARFLYSIKMK